jgi:hypothetical protein
LSEQVRGTQGHKQDGQEKQMDSGESRVAHTGVISLSSLASVSAGGYSALFRVVKETGKAVVGEFAIGVAFESHARSDDVEKGRHGG